MPDFAGFAPLVVPAVIGVILLRLLLELLFSLARRGPERAAAVRRAWGHYLTGMFFAGFLVPFLTPVFREPISTTPFWVLLFLGGIVAALHNGAVAVRGKGATPPASRSTVAQAQDRKAARAEARPQKAKNTPAPSWSSTTPPESPALPGSALDTVEQAIGKLPMPAVSKRQPEPLASERAESWFEGQDGRLRRALEGKTLAAARLRLSAVKSLLLLGQIGVREADQDVDMVLRQAGRG